MREQGSGAIVNNSSIGALIGIPGRATRMIFPMGSSFGKHRLAKASLIIATAGAFVLSRASNGRPARTGMPAAEKQSLVTFQKYTVGAAASDNSTWPSMVTRIGFGVGLAGSHFGRQLFFWPRFTFGDADVPGFISALKSTNARVRAATAEAIGEIQGINPDSRMVSVLAALLKDNDIQVRAAAAQVLKRIDPTAAANSGVE